MVAHTHFTKKIVIKRARVLASISMEGIEVGRTGTYQRYSRKDINIRKFRRKDQIPFLIRQMSKLSFGSDLSSAIKPLYFGS